MKTRLHLFQLKQLVSFRSVHVYVCPIVICLFPFLYFSIPINNWEHMHFLWLEQQIDVYLPHSRLFLSSSVEPGPHFPVSFANGQCHFLCHWVGMVATGTTPGHRLLVCCLSLQQTKTNLILNITLGPLCWKLQLHHPRFWKDLGMAEVTPTKWTFQWIHLSGILLYLSITQFGTLWWLLYHFLMIK